MNNGPQTRRAPAPRGPSTPPRSGNENDRLDYTDLIEQLHREYGEDLRARDYDTLVNVLGDSGARSIRAILRDYNAWRYSVSN